MANKVPKGLELVGKAILNNTWIHPSCRWKIFLDVKRAIKRQKKINKLNNVKMWG